MIPAVYVYSFSNHERDALCIAQNEMTSPCVCFTGRDERLLRELLEDEGNVSDMATFT